MFQNSMATASFKEDRARIEQMGWSVITNGVPFWDHVQGNAATIVYKERSRVNRIIRGSCWICISSL